MILYRKGRHYEVLSEMKVCWRKVTVQGGGDFSFTELLGSRFLAGATTTVVFCN